MKRILGILVGVLCFVLVLRCILFWKRETPSKLLGLSAERAMVVAQRSEEAKVFLALENRRFDACLSRRVVRPCDSDWVTCIDDAWVVEFAAEKACDVIHDGRLSLRILVGKEGNIISRFPEKEYFDDRQYCMESYDCLSVVDEGRGSCLNFIYAQMDKSIGKGIGDCECQRQQCILVK